MNRLTIGIQTALVIAVVALIVRVWPLMTQPVTHQSPAAVQVSSVGEMRLPDAASVGLAEVEKTLSVQSNWPSAREGVEKLQEKLKQALNSLSPAEQELALPRLVPRRWEIQALWLLAKENEPSDGQINAMRALADEIDLLNASAPAETSEELHQQLTNRKQELRDKVAKLELSLAVTQARAALNAKGSGDLEVAIRQIAGFDDDEARKLGYQLGLRRDLDSALADLEQLEKLTDPALKEYGLAKLNQNVMDLRLRVVLNMPKLGSPEKAAERLSSLEKNISDGYDKIVKVRRAEASKRARDYQIWALAQIKAVQTFHALEEAEVAKISGPIDRRNPMSDAHKAAVSRAMSELERLMISRMAPINQAVLDEAVAIWYRKVFQDRFESLNDEARKLRVVAAFAGADKRQIEQ